jgi:hypothetical protein
VHARRLGAVDGLGQLPYQRQHRVADVARLRPQRDEVDVAGRDAPLERPHVVLADHAQARLRPAQRQLGPQPSVDGGLLAEHPRHGLVREQGGEQPERTCDRPAPHQCISNPPSTLSACPVT